MLVFGLYCSLANYFISFVFQNEKEGDLKSMMTTATKHTVPGHTGYLTFATLPPVWARVVRKVSPDANTAKEKEPVSPAASCSEEKKDETILKNSGNEVSDNSDIIS